MARAPWSRPAAPNPKKARPKIRTAEYGAAAQITDPTTESQSVSRQVYQPAGVLKVTFEQEQRGKVNNFCVEILVEIAEEGLESGDGQQVRRAVPGNVVQRLEIRGYSRYCNSDDVHVQAEEEDAKTEGYNDNGKLPGPKVDLVLDRGGRGGRENLPLFTHLDRRVWCLPTGL